MDTSTNPPETTRKGRRAGRAFSGVKRLIGGYIATSLGPTRVEMSEKDNELRIYVDGELKAQFTDAQLRFLDEAIVAANILFTGGALKINALREFTDIELNAQEGDIYLDTGGNVIVPQLPTSSAGLPSGALWNDGGTVKIV